MVRSLEKTCFRYSEIWSSKNVLSSEQVAISSNKKFWFDCPDCSHEYEQAPHNKTLQKQGCSYCSNKLRCGKLECWKCLEKTCYKYANIWSDKNILSPEKVAISSGKKYWFDCKECGHVYEQIPSSKTSGHGCPYCSNKLRCGTLECEKCLEKTCYKYNEIWSDKNILLPEKVALNSHKKYWFVCKDCCHDYEQSPHIKTQNDGSCSYCSNKLKCGTLECEKCLEKTCYKYNEIWSDKNILSSEKVAISSGKKYWFDCKECGHVYEQIPDSKTSGRGCPYCSNKIRCGTLECEKCLEKTCYKYNEIWSDKNILSPEKVALNSHKKYWFDCKECGHDYEQSPHIKTQNSKGCPYCSNKVRCGELECGKCLEKSCYKYVGFWSSKNILAPEKVAISSNKKYWFKCDNNHDYEQSPSNKTQSGQGCPYCVNKTELKVSNFLKEANINFISQYKIGNINRFYDFYLKDYNLIIEIDGEQHFIQISNWKTPEKNLENDIQKMEVALINGMSILRIYQPDIWNDKIDWKVCISDTILNIRTLPPIIYISSNPGIYNNHSGV